MSELEQALLRDTGRAIGDHRLIDDGDRIMVAISGGKDSYALLHLLRVLRSRAPVDFEIIAVHVDQGQPEYDGRPLRDWLEREGHRFEIVREDTYSVVVDKIAEGKTYCSLCSRLRRGILYSTASRLGCNKIALGHHRDDSIETLMLNLFYAGRMAAMPARLTNDAGTHVVIRPLIYCSEKDLARFAVERAFPILPCNLCGSQSNLQRRQIKELLDRIEEGHPGIRSSMLAALGNVQPSHLLDGDLERLTAAAPKSTTPAGRRRLPLAEA